MQPDIRTSQRCFHQDQLRPASCRVWIWNPPDHEGPAMMFTQFMDRADVGMVERRYSDRLAHETVEKRSILNQFRRYEFERDMSLQLQLSGLVNYSHAAFADLANDFVSWHRMRVRKAAICIQLGLPMGGSQTTFQSASKPLSIHRKSLLKLVYRDIGFVTTPHVIFCFHQV